MLHLLAYDPPAFVEVPAAVVLSTIALSLVRWLLSRTTRADAATEARIAAVDAAIEERIATLEAKVQRLEDEVSKERHAKHEAMSKAASYLGALRVVKHIVEISEPSDIKKLLAPLLAEVRSEPTSAPIPEESQ